MFGSNREGRHGMGAALYARRNHGAVYGQAEGLQGDSYGIVTKELRRDRPPVTLAEVKEGVERFLVFAKDHFDMEFFVTAIGCGLAGFDVLDIALLFKGAPDNVILPQSFKQLL